MSNIQYVSVLHIVHNHLWNTMHGKVECQNMTSQPFVKLLFSSFRPHFFHQVVKRVNLTCEAVEPRRIVFPQCPSGQETQHNHYSKTKTSIRLAAGFPAVKIKWNKSNCSNLNCTDWLLFFCVCRCAVGLHTSSHPCSNEGSVSWVTCLSCWPCRLCSHHPEWMCAHTSMRAEKRRKWSSKCLKKNKSSSCQSSNTAVHFCDGCMYVLMWCFQ